MSVVTTIVCVQCHATSGREHGPGCPQNHHAHDDDDARAAYTAGWDACRDLLGDMTAAVLREFEQRVGRILRDHGTEVERLGGGERIPSHVLRSHLHDVARMVEGGKLR